MPLLKPDDFAGRPYEGGMNQALHHEGGKAVLGSILFLFPLTTMFWAILAAGIAVVLWEGWQLKKEDAKPLDYVFDLIYWFSGIAYWAILMQTESEFVTMSPVSTMLVWVIEFTRLSFMRHVR